MAIPTEKLIASARKTRYVKYQDAIKEYKLRLKVLNAERRQIVEELSNMDADIRAFEFDDLIDELYATINLTNEQF